MSSAPTLHHFTFSASENDVRMRLFADSARRYGFNTQVIRCGSTEEKPNTLEAAIAALPYDAIVCATDAFDVLCINTPESVSTAFLSSGRDLLFGAERAHYHHLKSSVEQFDAADTTSPYRYLNGGVFTGYASAVRMMLHEMRSWQFPPDVKTQLASKEDHFNDQTIFGRYAAMHPDRVGLDREARMCWNVADEWDEFTESLEHSQDPFVNPVTGTRPAFLHISHLRKYYPAYLWAARRLGLTIAGSTVNLRLFDQHVVGVVEGVDSGSIPPDPETTAILNKSLEYRAMKLVDRTKERLKRARMDLGRRRREIFHRDTA